MDPVSQCKLAKESAEGVLDVIAKRIRKQSPELTAEQAFEQACLSTEGREVYEIFSQARPELFDGEGEALAEVDPRGKALLLALAPFGERERFSAVERSALGALVRLVEKSLG